MLKNILDTVILIGFIQGIICATILFYKKERAHNRFLAWIILLISLACLNIYLINSIEHYSNTLIILSFCVPLIVIMPIGPLIYQFVLTYTEANKFISKKHYHLLWIDLFPNVLAVIVFVGMAFSLLDSGVFQKLDVFTDHYNKYVDILRWISLTLYTIVAFKYLKKASVIDGKWALYLVIGFLGFEFIWLIFLIPYLIPSLSNYLLDFFNWYPLYIPLVILIYLLGFGAIMQVRKQSISNPLNPKVAKDAIVQLKQLMTNEKVYRDPLLRLDSVVDISNIPQKTISASLNQVEGKTFKEFVNSYRIEEVKLKLIDPTFNHLTITGIAYECGFNSQATFQRTFKNLVGESPSAFRTRFLSKNSSQN